MILSRPVLTLLGSTLALSCGGSQHASSSSSAPPHMTPQVGAAMNAHPDHMMAEVRAGNEDAFGPLEIGADFATSMTRVNREPFVSPTHGRRWVNVYVNAIGLEAYEHDRDLPVGSIVVKESFEDAGGHPDLAQRGPTFVMERRAAGYDPSRADYWYAIHWAQPVGPHGHMDNGQPLPPIYWRGHSNRVGYCEDCHSGYDHRMGGVPEGNRVWETAGAGNAGATR